MSENKFLGFCPPVPCICGDFQFKRGVGCVNCAGDYPILSDPQNAEPEAPPRYWPCAGEQENADA